MVDKVRVKTVLISVHDKSGVDELARRLRGYGCRILASGGTQKFLAERDVEAEPLERFTGFSQLLGGRVKTLHPSVHAMLLARAEDIEEIERQGLCAVDLVIVNLYPFERGLAEGKTDVELIDIGGVALIRAAAKNFERVAVVCDPEQYPQLLEELEANDGHTTLAFRKQLAAFAFRRTALYDTAIASWLAEEFALPDPLTMGGRKLLELRYGENPHQRAALYAPAFPLYGIHLAKKIQGKELSYNNLLDAWSAWLLVNEFDEPAAAVIKHTNPCGVALGGELSEAYVKAREADPVSAFGGIVGLNREADRRTAEEIVSTFVEVVVAPSFSDEALEIFARKPNLRLLQMPPPESQNWLEVRSLGGALLVQEHDAEVWDRKSLRVIGREPSPEEWRDIEFAWKVVKHVKSNAIVVAKRGATLGIGAGQMNRVGALKIALEGAGEKAKGAVVASDGFFPFRDSVDLAAKFGISCLVQPGGSVRDEEVVSAAHEHGITMVLTGMRHFRH